MNLNIGNIGVRGFRHYGVSQTECPSSVGFMRLNGTLENYLKDVKTISYRGTYCDHIVIPEIIQDVILRRTRKHCRGKQR